MARVSNDSLEEVARWTIQLRKGVLEFAILLILREREHYGFELVTSLTSKSQINVPEGTIYPLLLRLAKDGLIEAQLRDGEGGAPRKYYTLTRHGHTLLEAMIPRWEQLSSSVGYLLAGERK